jgi:hypothetical protein
MLVDGKWSKAFDPLQGSDSDGRFLRNTSVFRNWITPDGGAGPGGAGGFRAEAGRYHLYVALICPWASRTLMARKLKGLEEVISVTVVEPFLYDQCWRFGDYPGAGTDLLYGADPWHGYEIPCNDSCVVSNVRCFARAVPVQPRSAGGQVSLTMMSCRRSAARARRSLPLDRWR